MTTRADAAQRTAICCELDNNSAKLKDRARELRERL